MSPKRVWCGVAAAVILLAGCGKRQETPAAKPAETPAAQAPAAPAKPKPATVEIVAEQERSRNFVAVNRHLELGGTLYGYVDIDGDVQKIASGLKETFTQLQAADPKFRQIADQDLAGIAEILGLTDIKAIGISSVPDGTGFFRNRAFFYMPGERRGLMLGFGGQPRPLKHVNLAPADAALFAEVEVDIPVVYRTIRDVVTKVAGEPAGNQLEAALKKAGEDASLSVLDLIHGLKGNSAVVLRMDAEKTIQLPGPSPITLPAFALMYCIEGVGPIVEPALAKSPVFKRADVDGAHVFTFAQPLPLPDLQPVFVVEGTTLYFATSQAFLDECRARKAGLATSREFKEALAAVGEEANGMAYFHPRLFDGLRRIGELNPNLPPQAKPVVGLLLSKVPKIDRPIVTLRTNLSDGILVRSHWHRSLKQEVAMVAVYNPVSLGLMAGMAIPAFQKVRASSQEKAVLNNLRQLASAADQYYLEHGVTTVTYDQLVGPEEEKYIKHIQSVAGEDYSTLEFEQGEPLEVHLPDGRVVRYEQ